MNTEPMGTLHCPYAFLFESTLNLETGLFQNTDTPSALSTIVKVILYLIIKGIYNTVK